ncbi:MAG TPA: MATE family efflux transporter [Longimicrobiales bacterium]|nr:MATE family efflux transporter [Longimicrobiales bacterium]
MSQDPSVAPPGARTPEDALVVTPPPGPARPSPLAWARARGERADLREELRRLLALAVPLVVSHLATIGMSTVDTLMVGPLGAGPLAGLAIGGAIHSATLMVSMGLLLGMSPLVSQAHGAGRPREPRRVLVQGLWLALALSVPMVALSLAGEPLALALGQAPAVSARAGEYLTGVAAGIPPVLIFMALRGYVEGLGTTRPSMVFLLLGFAVNVPANALLVYGALDLFPALGVAGAGWATSLVRWVMLAAMAAWLLRHPELHPFHGVRLVFRVRRVARILRLGVPISAQMALEVGLFAFAAIMMGWFGPLPLAAHQVTINLAATTFMVALGTALAGTIRVGFHVGGRRPEGVHRTVVATYTLAVGFMALCALAFLLAPRFLLGLYTQDPEILALGSRLLFIAALFQVFDGAQVAGICLLRGAGDTRIPMMMAGLGYWAVGLPTAYGLAFHTGLGPAGVWVGLSAGLAVVAVLMGLRVRRMLWRGEMLRPRARQVRA